MEAVILAGGLGTRLRGVIGEIPKCMAPVDGKPFLQYQLEWLSRFDVRHVVFSVGYLREQVMDFVQGREWPFAVSFAIRKNPWAPAAASAWPCRSAGRSRCSS